MSAGVVSPLLLCDGGNPTSRLRARAREEMRMHRRYGEISWEAGSADAPTGAAATAPSAATSPNTSGTPFDLVDRPRVGSTTRKDHRTRGEVNPSSLLPTIRLHGVRLHAITEEQCIDHILSELDAGRGGTVVTPHLDHIRRCTNDMIFRAIVA